MDLYTFSLLLGGAGLAAMGLHSVGHHGASSHAAGHGHGHAGSHSHGHGTAHHGHAAHPSPGRAALALLSPRIIFSILLGVGLTGLLGRSFLAGVPLAVVALVGGGLFERLAVAPLWHFLMRFTSSPALTLEHCITDDATAVTAFDPRGHGLIAIELDGQLIQVLGTLRRADRDAGRQVRAGDRVRIETVDAVRNRCTVSVP